MAYAAVWAIMSRTSKRAQRSSCSATEVPWQSFVQRPPIPMVIQLE